VATEALSELGQSTSIVAAEAAEPASERLDRQTVAIVAVLGLAAFMSVLDGTIVTVAIDTFATTFDSTVSTIVWVSVGYLLAAGAALPTAGWAAERFGGRRVFLAGLGLFVLGSALASLSWSAASLIGFRVIQGFGGGMLEPTSLTLAAKSASKGQMGRVMGVLGLIVNVAPVLGPLTGGLFTDGGHWRWIFLINLPIGAVVAVWALAVLPKDSGTRETAPLDIRGLLLLTPGFVLTLLAIDRFGDDAAWWIVATPAVAAAVLFAAYLRHALTTDRPVINPRLFAGRSFASSVVVMMFVGVIMYSQLVALPLFLDREHDLTGIRGGLLTSALGVGLLLSMSMTARRSDVTGPRDLVGPGAVGTAIGLGVFSAAGADLPLGALVALFVIVGLAFGSVAAPTFSSVYRTVPSEATSQATTTLFIAVQVSASLGLTVVGLLLDGSGRDRFGTLFAILAAAAVATAALSRLLPGRPAVAAGAP
jgi:EmrB/QacA subfamily drug resistance transporter